MARAEGKSFFKMFEELKGEMAMPIDKNKEYKVSYSNASPNTITTTNPHWLATDYLDNTIKTYGITDRTSDIEKDIENLKNIVMNQQKEIRRLSMESEERAYQVQAVSKDLRTLAVETPKPYAIGEMALSKLTDFILAFKEARTDSNGVTQEMISVQKLLGAIDKIKEVIKPNDDKDNRRRGN